MYNLWAGLLAAETSMQEGNCLAAVEFLDANPQARWELEDSWSAPDGKVFQIVLEDPPEGSEIPRHIEGYVRKIKKTFPVLNGNPGLVHSLGLVFKVLIPDWGTTAYPVFEYYLGTMKEKTVNSKSDEEVLKSIISWINGILEMTDLLGSEDLPPTWETGLVETDGRNVLMPVNLPEDSEDDQEYLVQNHEGPSWNRPQFDNFRLKVIHDPQQDEIDWVFSQASWFHHLYYQVMRAGRFGELYTLLLPYRTGEAKFNNGIQARVMWDLYDTMFTKLVNKGYSRFLRMKNLSPEEASKNLESLFKTSAMFRKSAGNRQIHLTKQQYSYYWSVYNRCFDHLLEMTGKRQLVLNCIARVNKSENPSDLYRFVSWLNKGQENGRISRLEASPIWRAFYAKRAEFYPVTETKEDPAYVPELQD